MHRIFLISQSKVNGYDSYDSAVVVAENEEAARSIHPGGHRRWMNGGWMRPVHGRAKEEAGGVDWVACDFEQCDWSDPEDVEVTPLGVLTSDQYENYDIICASFNAG